MIELPGDLAPERTVDALRHLPGLVFLDSSRPDVDHGRYSYVTADPFLTVASRGRRVALARPTGTTRLVDDPFATLQGLLRQYRHRALDDLPPFQGGAVGYFGFDLGRQIEALPAIAVDDLGLPELHVGLYDWVIAWDHRQQRAWLVATGLPDGSATAARARAAQIERLLAATPRPEPLGVPAVGALRANVTRSAYLAAVERAKQSIDAGDIYQVNLSQRFAGLWPRSCVPTSGDRSPGARGRRPRAAGADDPWLLYRRLREVSPVPYAAFLELGEATILSASPECFLRFDGRVVETHPIKGTRPRGATPAEDARLADELRASVKDRAENVMIVDLLRNDLGKVCAVGSVRVPRLFAVEGYSHVWQLVSTIVGELQPERDALDLLRACFPGGSVTGCPKIRAMEIIEELEPVRRGVYCGAIGYLAFGGAMTTSIVIRTLLLTRGAIFLPVGGAIVADSDPAAEYQETLTKAAAALAALGATVVED